MRVSLWLATASVIALATVRCASYGSQEEPTPTFVPSDDGSPPDVREADPPDAGPAVLDAASCAVRVASMCIDPTEVTIAEFRGFVTAVGPSVLDAGAPCSATTLRGLGVAPNEKLPISEVTFCEARAFCLWKGKHLCGRFNGGTLASNETGTQNSVWYNACTAGSTTRTLVTLDGGRCQLDAAAPKSSGSTCQGGLQGLFDMVGNVNEWVDAPFERDGGTKWAVLQGGGFRYPAATTNCATAVSARIDDRFTDVGFRCCWP
jgi:formylglycine-generating enzyme required for sulfatase activity